MRKICNVNDLLKIIDEIAERGLPYAVGLFTFILSDVNTSNVDTPFIRVVRGSTAFQPSRAGLAKRLLVVYEWVVDDLADLKPPMSFRELEDRVTEGVEFANDVFGELYAYHLISAPFIVSPNRVYYIGGSRLALYGEHSEQVKRGVLSLSHFMHRVVKYTEKLYTRVQARKWPRVLEVVASRSYRELRSSVGMPVESIGLVKKAPVDYALDPEVAEAVFYYRTHGIPQRRSDDRTRSKATR